MPALSTGNTISYLTKCVCLRLFKQKNKKVKLKKLSK